MKFYASVRLDVRRVESLKVGQEVVGARTRVRVVKNKVAPPFKVAEFDILYNEGISKAGDILDLGVELGVIEKRGAFFTYAPQEAGSGEQRIGQGRENARQFLKDNPQIAAEIEATVQAQAARQDDLLVPAFVLESALAEADE